MCGTYIKNQSAANAEHTIDLGKGIATSTHSHIHTSTNDVQNNW